MPAVLSQDFFFQGSPKLEFAQSLIQNGKEPQREVLLRKMEVASYKHYLHLAKKAPRLSLFEKILFLTLALVFVIVGITSAYYYYLYKKETPIRAQNQYLNIAESGFGQTKIALSEMLTSFQVAGVKIQKVEGLAENPDQASGFFTSLADIEKILSQIELVTKNVQNNQQALENTNVPPDFSGLNTQILNFYIDLIKLLKEVYGDHNFLKQMLLAVGPNLYLPTLSQDGLWENQESLEIIKFYQVTKDRANSTLSNLAKLTVPANFGDYYQAQISYLELLVEVSDGIINTLSIQEESQSESATQIEKAYQILTFANQENEALSQKILTEKLRLFDPKKNLDRFAQIKIPQNSIALQLTEAIAKQPQPKLYFLRGRQLPTLFW